MTDCFVLFALFSFHFIFFSFSFFKMPFKLKRKGTGGPPIVEAKSLFSKGDVKEAFEVLNKAAENEDVMACYDCGFMMIQGIGCENSFGNMRKGFELMEKGRTLEEKSSDMSWKLYGSVTELFEPQTMELSGLLLLVRMI